MVSDVIVTTLDSTKRDSKVLELIKYENSHGEKFYRVKYSYNNGGSGESIPITLYSDAKRYFSFAKKILLT